MCCNIGTWLRDHLLREACLSPLGVPPGWGIQNFIISLMPPPPPCGQTTSPGGLTASPCIAPSLGLCRGTSINMYQCYQYKACNIRRHVYLQHGNQSLVFFASASLKHQGLVALSPSVASPVSRATPWCAAPPPLMATDHDHHGAKFRKKLDAMVAAATNVKKRYDATRTRVLTATALLEEEQCTVVILIEEAHVMVALIEPPSPTLPPAPIGGAALSDDDYEAIIIANIHVQAISVQNICSLISVMLDLSSTHYTQWHDSILLTLGRYSLSNHILMDTMYVDVPSWD
jgi:hypothetical protein